jgi:hypothetical protein
MKENFGNDYFLLAHVDADKVRYTKTKKLGIEFKNEIDAWSKMTFKFRGARYNEAKYVHNDLRPFVYSFRTPIE